jgi:hypothetical protein
MPAFLLPEKGRFSAEQGLGLGQFFPEFLFVVVGDKALQ